MLVANRSSLRIALVQMSCVASREANFAKAQRFIRDATKQGAQVICLQELFMTPYFCREHIPSHFDLAESIPGPTTERLSRIAAELKVVIVAGLFERRAPGIYHNTVAVLGSQGELLGLYRKMHIPDEPMYYEKYYFAPGDLGFPVFDTVYGPIGIQICWDQWYPEGARVMSLGGAVVLFYPSAIGWQVSDKLSPRDTDLEAWRTIHRSHAIANGVYVAALNRVGIEGSSGNALEFWGASFVTDPSGKVIKEALTNDDEIIMADIDPGECERVRRLWPFLRDRRVDAYDPILRIWRD